MNTIDMQSGSSSVSPDLDWSQVRETLRMLNLAVAQITWSLKEGDDSVETLGRSFTSMAGAITAIEGIMDELPANVETGVKQAVSEKCANLSGKIQSAIIAFQFYDRITQQLTHVCNSLFSLGELVSDPHKLYHPYEWSALQNQIRSKYTMKNQREMFDALMQGTSIEQVLEMYKENCKGSKDADDVELF